MVWVAAPRVLRPVQTTYAPAAASSTAVARPSPREAPDTSASLSARGPSMPPILPQPPCIGLTVLASRQRNSQVRRGSWRASVECTRIERMFDLGNVRGAAVALSGIGEGSDDVERIDLIRALEELKCAAEGAQAVLTAAFDRSQRAAEAAAGVPVERQGRAVAAQVALARRESPHRGRQHVGLALVLRDEMPCTRRALVSGRITGWRAMLLARETACLSRAGPGRRGPSGGGRPRRPGGA